VVKENRSSNSCVRQGRDVSQITRCRDSIDQISPNIETLATRLSLAGNEVRLKILLLLQSEERLCVCDLTEILGMTVPAVSQHLKKMKEGGLLTTYREGSTIYQQLSLDAIDLLEALLPLVAEEVV